MSWTGYLGAGDFWVSPATMHQGAFHASSADLGMAAAATYACVWAKPWHRALSLGAGLWALYAGGAPGRRVGTCAHGSGGHAEKDLEMLPDLRIFPVAHSVGLISIAYRARADFIPS